MDAVSSVQGLLDRVVGLLGEVNGRDLNELVDAETTEVALLAARVARLAEAAQVRTIDRLDRSKEWVAEGARSLPVWVGWKAGMPTGRARAVVRCARQLRSMPVAEEALAAGRIGIEHVRLLAHAQHANPEAFEAHEARLVTAGERQLYTAFERVIRYWVQVHAPDRAEADAAEQHDQRRVHASRSFEGTIVVDAMLDSVTGEIWLRELERLEQHEFDADWSEARSRLGDAAATADLCRTPRQRRADALRIMAERSAAKLPGATEARPLIHVVAGTETLKNVCELSNGTVITPGQLLPILRWADLARVIFDGPSRIIDVGVRQRLFTGATRVAVERRDMECQHPSCDTPAERCEIDHVIPYEAGGLTIQDNGQCLCPYHHRHKERQPQPVA